MNNRILWMPLKLMGIFFIVILLLIIPICAVFAPVVYLGSIFDNSFGTLKDNFDIDYDSNFTDELDSYIYENRISPDYNGITGCIFYESTDTPADCLSSIDEDGRLSEIYDHQQFLDIDEDLYIGSYDDFYFDEIHVLGKYTVSKYEKVGEHEETRLVENAGSGPYTGPQYETVIVEEYDWVYYPEIQRGKCESSDTIACNIILEDKDVYPYQMITFNKESSFGLCVDPESYEISFNSYQEWSGDMLYAFSKGTVISANGKEITLQIDANDVDLYARYESEEGYLSSLFSPGETVEAAETIAYSEGNTRLYIYNSRNEYINPALFVFEKNYYTGLGNGTIIIGMEDFAPDFSDTRVWYGYDDGGINPYGDDHMGQCTWFAWGLFYQHYGFDPGFRGKGENSAYQTYQNLKDQGWTFSRSPSPGAVFSTTNFNHVGIVAGVIDEDTMIIVEANFNHKNDTFKEFISLPDWAMRVVSTKQYKPGVGFIYCNPPQG
ncbi:MAG: CHAP domain-containing protein [Erysipelotrichaceae bacterium]|nr:CHAP domain-containing protein [Erysipelotrichaceae bacterium]